MSTATLAAIAALAIVPSTSADVPSQKAQPPKSICAFPDVCRTVAL